MAVLADPDRSAVWTQWMRDNRDPCGAMTKAELRAAVNAIDDWAEANAAEFNLAIPQPARAALSARQKAWLLFYVLRRRFEVA